MTDFYVKTGTPASHSSGASASMRAEFTAIETAMAKLAGYTGNGSKFLRVNAAGTAYEALTVADALAALAPSSAALATALTDTTGTGVFVRTQAPTLTSATLVTPALGTPASGVLTNCTGTASGLTAGNVTTNANLTGGVTSVGNAATVVTNANLTGHITSVGNAAVLGSFTSLQLKTALSDETGSGAAVFATSPTLVTPALGTPSSGNLANCTFPTLNQNTTGSAASTGDLTGTPTFFAPITNSTGSSVSLSAGSFVDGPSIAQGTSGKWFASGTITCQAIGGIDLFNAKLWDGTTVIASTLMTNVAQNYSTSISLSGFISSPAGNLRISVEAGRTGSLIRYNASTGGDKDSTITAIRVG